MPNNHRRHHIPDQDPWWVIVLPLALELARLANTALTIAVG